MAKDILFNLEARDNLKKGVDALSNDREGNTTDLKDRNVIIEKYLWTLHRSPKTVLLLQKKLN